MNHLSEKVLNQHRQRTLAPDQLLEVDDHLADCEQCHLAWLRTLVDANKTPAALYADLMSSDPAFDDHLSYEALETLVDDAANDVDREIAKVHLETCAGCAAELQALEGLRDHKPADRLVEVPEKSFFRLGSWPRLAFATVATLAIAALVWSAWRSQRSSVETSGSHIATFTTPSPVLKSSPMTTPSAVSSPDVVVSLNDAGGTVSLDQTGKIEGLANLSPKLITSVKTALTTQQLNMGPAVAGLQNKAGILMGSSTDGAPFKLLSPVGVVVRSNRPSFRWQSYPGATAYVVKVYDSNFKALASSLSQTATSWKVPVTLPRGQIYKWQVTALKDGEEVRSPTAPAPEARFRVLAQEQDLEIERLRNIRPVSHLALGTLYAEAGLLEDARREFRILVQANPGSKVAQKLLQEVSR